MIDEDWSSGRIGPQKWYVLRKQWGAGNHGVVPENVRIEQDTVHGRRQNVLVCTARGDRYSGPVSGIEGKPTRVGGVVVSKPFLASGRYEVVMKIGSTHTHAGGPANPAHPRGAVPAKRLERDSYALYTGEKAVHWIDGRMVGENRRYVPAMAAQLNLGVWLPQWAGPAPWETTAVRFASVRVWQYDDPGDVPGVLIDDINDNFTADGRRLR